MMRHSEEWEPWAVLEYGCGDEQFSTYEDAVKYAMEQADEIPGCVFAIYKLHAVATAKIGKAKLRIAKP